MKIASTLEVADKLRELKLFSSALNNKDVNKWDEHDKKEWECILSGEPFKAKKVYYQPNGLSNKVKVIRVSDGRLFDSITECREHNGYHKTEMEELLKLGKIYKRIE